MKSRCETFSNDGNRYELIEKEFDIDEEDAQEPFWCEAYEPKQIEL